MDKTVNVLGKDVVITELKYLDILEIEELKSKSLRDANKLLFEKCTNLSAEEIDSLKLQEGLTLQNAINELNGFGDFQAPVEKK